MKVKVGDKVYIPNETIPYEVQARDDRYIICTQWLNNWYFIVDLVEKWRAPDDRLFCRGYTDRMHCKKRLKELQKGEINLSIKRGLPLDIDIE